MTKSKPELLSSTEIEAAAQRCSLAAQKGKYTIEYTAHAREQMDARAISENQVLKLLEFGRHVEGQDRFNEEENGYSYLLRDSDIEERDMAASIALIEDDGEKVLIVTAMLVDPITGKYL